MATPPRSSAVSLGGKGSSLTPAAVYAVAGGLSGVRLDSSALEKLAQSKSSSPPPPLSDAIQNPRFLTLEESRATLAVLLNKLLVADASVRPALPTLIEEVLSLPSGHETLDFRSPLRFLESICRLNGRKVEEIKVSGDEIGVFEASAAAPTAICAILDCCSSALVRVSDAVAALSCEASRADVGAFDLPVSGDGFSIKDETDVAGDMKVMLFGSKLVGQNYADSFAEIPTVHGSFREAVRTLHGRTRVELNSSIKVRKKSTGLSNQGKEKALVASALPLAMAIRSMSEISLGRAKLIVESIRDVGIKSTVSELFRDGCLGFDRLKDQFDSVTQNAAVGSDYVSILSGVYDLLVKFRNILAWEAVLALFTIEIDDSIEKIQGSSSTNAKPNGETVKGDKKSEKKKKKTLGKGTSAVMQLLRNRVMNGKEITSEHVTALVNWARDLSFYFDPKDKGLDTLIEKVKEIVESNEVRRLPKIPKGTRDFGKEQMAIRERAFSIITSVFKMHGAVGLDTPVFELRETLMGKYGEDSKLIYDLADQIKLNHRKLLDGMLEICGVPPEKFRTVCSSIDKLDKQTFEQIKKELVEEKGLAIETAEKIGTFVEKRGPPLEILSELKKEGSQFMENSGAVVALNELDILFKALEKSKCLDKVVFDLSLARGLDYYTGVIYEAVFKGATQVIRATETQVLVAILGKDLTLAAELVSELWKAKINAEFKLTKRVMNHINYAKQSGIPWMVLVGESELEKGIVKLKNIEANQEEEVPRKTFVEELQRRINSA
ncbi:Histidine--tRNA ligase, cytoplasmic [Ananas comosus]|uniref:histidine--tRNA ligase n=1 Tax=Ananas comosus TaxID=4615 RepID=A0A199V3W8_ANACO|nr:Histidine--tRNA ligase, cytoplasmic [Ananas comosus]